MVARCREVVVVVGAAGWTTATVVGGAGEVVGAIVVEVVVVGATVVDVEVDVVVVVGAEESALAKCTTPAVVDKTASALAHARSSARARVTVVTPISRSESPTT
jgi:hypothetical protein